MHKGVYVLLGVMLAACTAIEPLPTEAAPAEASAAPPALPTRPLPDRAEPVTVTAEPEPITGEAPEAVLAAVTADLVERTGADEAAIEVVEDRAMVWSDGSLGCPQPGQVYTQALVEGYLVRLRYEGAIYHYHVGSSPEQVVLCENPSSGGVAPQPLPTQGVSTDGDANPDQ